MALPAHGESVEPYEWAHLSRAAPLAPFDRLRMSGRIDLIVIPAEAGIQEGWGITVRGWITAFAVMTEVEWGLPSPLTSTADAQPT